MPWLRAPLLSLAVFATSAARAETTEVWTQRGPALVEPGSPKSSFGDSVAISGNTVVVTSAQSDVETPYGGAAYVFERIGAEWSFVTPPLVVSDGMSGAHLGRPCALAGNYFVAGALYAASGYAFTRSGRSWGASERLVAAGEPEREWWVTSAALSGDTAIVGVPYRNITLGMAVHGDFQGAYVFVRLGNSWVPQGTLQVEASMSTGLGWAVSISGDTAVLTATRIAKAFIFTRTAGVWSQQGPALLAPSEVLSPQNFGDGFGRAVALSSHTLLIGAKRSDSVGAPAGVVYEYVRTNGVWERSALVLEPADTDPDFGAQLSFSGDTAVIGSYRAAYVFARGTSGWVQQGRPIVSLDSEHYPMVALDGQTAVVGVSGKTAGELGTAYIFSDACETDTDCGTTGYCDAGTCRAGCSYDSECPRDRYCAADGICRTPLRVAHACGDATLGGGCKEPGCAICTTGHCVDAVCCNSACNGTCEACVASLTGGEDGACLPIAADLDPEDECAAAPNFPASCLADGACDGKRACRAYAKAGTACGDTTCVDGRVAASVCDSGGACQNDSASCAPYICAATACTTSCKTDADCDPSTGYCLSGKCAAKEPSGDAGAAGSEDGGASGSGGESGSSVADAGEATMVGGAGGRAAGPNGDAGAGMHTAGNDDTSSEACGCRVAGSTAFAFGHDLLPLLGLLLLSARRQRARGRQFRSYS